MDRHGLENYGYIWAGHERARSILSREAHKHCAELALPRAIWIRFRQKDLTVTVLILDILHYVMTMYYSTRIYGGILGHKLSDVKQRQWAMYILLGPGLVLSSARASP